MIVKLFYSHILNINRGSIPYKKFQAHTLFSLKIPIDYKCLMGPEKFPGLLRNRSLQNFELEKLQQKLKSRGSELKMLNVTTSAARVLILRGFGDVLQ